MSDAQRFYATGLCFSLCIGLAAAEEYKAGSIEVSHVWARPSAPGAKNGAAYVTLKNAGKDGDTLLSVESPSSEKAEIHQHIHEGDVMRVQRVDAGVGVPAGQTVTFNPGSYHIMLLGLKDKLEDGKSLPLKLHFAKAGDVQVEIKIGNGG